MSLRFVSVLTFALCLASGVSEASGVRYGYYNFSADYEYYGGLRTNGVRLNVHEFSLNDSSGEFSAAMQTTANRLSAQAAAENKEREAVRKGESAGGPKILTYQYEQAQARSGDSKIYGLRLGSTDNAFNGEPITGNTKKDGLITHAEIFLKSAFYGGVLYSNDLMSVAWNMILGFRWGGIKQNDKSQAENTDKFRDAGYFYVPLTGRISAFLPFSISAGFESGLDPITLFRQHALDVEMPLDRFYSAFVEYRFDVLAVGLHMERYLGSLIAGPGKKIKNPVYDQELIGAYILLGVM